METPSTKMRERRIELGISQEELAKRIGVTRGTVNRWENGNIRTMKSDVFAKAAKALQMSPDELLGYEQPEAEAYSMTPQQEVLFHASADLTEAEMDAIMTMIKVMKSNRGAE